MIEGILIACIIMVCRIFPMRGKTLEQLSEAQHKWLMKQYTKYMKTRKGRSTPDMTVNQYLTIIQKQALKYLITLIVLAPIYILAMMFLLLDFA